VSCERPIYGVDIPGIVVDSLNAVPIIVEGNVQSTRSAEYRHSDDKETFATN
jgi:hypothetical protein